MENRVIALQEWNDENIISNDLANKENFEKIYNTYFDSMHLRAYSKTRSKDAASNIVQDVFINLWEKRHTLEIKTSVEHYLMRSLKFKIIDHFRANEVYRKHKEAKTEAEERLNRTTEEDVEFNELQGRLTTLVEQLPPPSQKIYRLSREKGYTNREISKSMDVSERTISSHLSKALSYLKRHLTGDYESLN